MSIFADFGRATRKGYNRVIEARERQAKRYVHGALLNLDDKTLNELGYNRSDLERDHVVALPF